MFLKSKWRLQWPVAGDQTGGNLVEEFHNQVATELFEVIQDLEKTTGLATGMPYNCASFLLLQHNSWDWWSLGDFIFSEMESQWKAWYSQRKKSKEPLEKILMKDRLDVVMEEKQGDSRLVNPEEDFKSLGDAEANQEVAPTMILEEQISQQLMPRTQQQKQKKSWGLPDFVQAAFHVCSMSATSITSFSIIACSVLSNLVLL